jgi:hypothetical protein
LEERSVSEVAAKEIAARVASARNALVLVDGDGDGVFAYAKGDASMVLCMMDLGCVRHAKFELKGRQKETFEVIDRLVERR